MTERSGQESWVLWRFICSTYLRQSFVEWVGETIPRSFWAKAFYERHKAKGVSHNAAIRALAFKWIRILWRCGPTAPPTTNPPTSLPLSCAAHPSSSSPPIPLPNTLRSASGRELGGASSTKYNINSGQYQAEFGARQLPNALGQIGLIYGHDLRDVRD